MTLSIFLFVASLATRKTPAQLQVYMDQTAKCQYTPKFHSDDQIAKNGVGVQYVGSARTTKIQFKATTSAGKVMATVFCNTEEVTMMNYPVKAITSDNSTEENVTQKKLLPLIITTD